MTSIYKKGCQSHNSRIEGTAGTTSLVNSAKSHSKQPTWEIIVEAGLQIPDEEWAKVPADASINYKYYLYGVPKKNT